MKWELVAMVIMDKIAECRSNQIQYQHDCGLIKHFGM